MLGSQRPNKSAKLLIVKLFFIRIVLKYIVVGLFYYGSHNSSVVQARIHVFFYLH